MSFLEEQITQTRSTAHSNCENDEGIVLGYRTVDIVLEVDVA